MRIGLCAFLLVAACRCGAPDLGLSDAGTDESKSDAGQALALPAPPPEEETYQSAPCEWRASTSVCVCGEVEVDPSNCAGLDPCADRGDGSVRC